MDDDKFLGEPSNPNNSRSLLNNNNSNANNLNSTATGTGHRPSSSNQNKMSSVNTDDSSIYGDGGDDVGWWDCSLCTYKNSADKFKCEICDLRRGTSTRKPRCNADTIVAQVVKQQEQIRQQTRVKPPKSRSSVTGVANPTSTAASSSTESIGKAKSRSRLSDSSKSSRLRPDNDVNTEDESSSDSVSLPEPKKKKTRDSKSTKRSNGKVSKNLKNDDDNSTDSDSTFLSSRSVSRSSLSTGTPTDCASSSSSSDSEVAKTSPLPPTKSTQENPLKITPLEVNGNLIKYSPPTSSGRTGLIIDKKRFTQHSVTVNDVTITFTEFATRQNKYIRKKKKRREFTKSKNNNANGKSRGKIDSKSSNQNAPSTASGDA